MRYLARVEAVSETYAGSELTVQVAAAGVLLTLDDVSWAHDDGGAIIIGGVDARTYDVVDFDLNTLHLTAGVSQIWPVDTIVVPTAGSVIRTADLFFQGQEEEDAPENLVARVPTPFFDRLDIGARNSQTGEWVIVEEIGGELVVVDFPGEELLASGEYFDPTTIPPAPATDGVPPSTSPTPTVLGLIGMLLVKWSPVVNADPVTYEVHVSTTTGFTPGAGTLAGEISGTMFSIRQMPDATPLSYGTIYYVKIIAKDADPGTAPASAEGSGSMVQVDTPDIAINAIIAGHILAGQIDASRLAAELLMASTIYVPSDTGQHVKISPDGIELVSAAGVSLVEIPTDPAKDPTFSGEIIAGALDVQGDAHFRGANNTFEKGSETYIESGVGPPVTKPTVTSVWDHQDLATSTGLTSLRYGLVYTATGGATETVPSFATVHQAADGQMRLLEATAAAPATLARSANVIYGGGDEDFVPMGLCKHGSSYYVLVQYKPTSAFSVYRLRVSDLVLTNIYSGISVATWQDEMFMGSDGTNIIIVDRAGSNPDSTFYRFRKFDASMAFVSTLTSDFNPGDTDTFSGCSLVVRDDGSGTRYWLAGQRSANLQVHVFDTAGVHQVNECFYVEGSYTKGLAHDGTQFWSANAWGGLSKHTNWKWTTESALYWVGYTWYDDAGTAHETTIGPRQSVTHKKRSKMRITTGTIPVGGADDPNKVRIYINRGAAEPQASGRFDGKRQAEDSNGVRELTDFNAAGTQNPATNDFPGSTPGFISAGGTYAFEVHGGSKVLAPGSNHSLLPAGVERQIIYDQDGKALFIHNGLFWVPCSPLAFERHAYMQTDFLENTGTAPIQIIGGASMIGPANHPGVLRLTVVTAENARWFSGNEITFGSGAAWWGALVRTPSAVSDATNRYQCTAGMYDNLDPGASTDGIFFFLQDNINTGFWQGRVKVGGVQTLHALTDNGGGVAHTVGGWYLLEIFVNAAGTQVDFYINRILKGSVTTNIPVTTENHRGGIIKNVGAAGRSFDIDMAYQLIETSGARY